MFIVLPKGARERPAILKCCLPQGMPITVMHRSTPKKIWQRHAHNPPKIIHRMFRKRLRHPAGDAPSVTVEPKGQRHKRPILNVCNAQGIPMIVSANARLAVKYPMAASRPPKTSQMMLPNIFIFLMF